MRTKSAALSGWGRYPQVNATVARPEQYRELATWAKQASIARGMGRAYGDAAISANGTTVLTERLDRLLSFDAETGILRAEAGVTLDTILRVVMSKGWFLPVTPGTRYVTLGGAIAADVHGKNHHHVGSFGGCVRALELFTASGAMTCSATHNVPAYQATLGGMGMTGLIGEVELQLKRIPSSDMLVQHVPAANLRESIALMAADEQDDEYTVSWIDCLASGAKLGRSVLMRGHHTDGAHTSGPREARLSLPLHVPSIALNRYSVGAFNALYYRWEGRKTKPFRCDFEPFFYPLDGIKQWHRLYGKPGFVQYQFVVAQEAAEACIGEVLTAVSNAGNASFLAVLKRFGAAGDGLLSFPQPGMTLALDLPLRAGTLALLDRLDAIVLAHAGRVYLAKDARLNARMLAAMYPQLGQWQAIRRELDPDGLFVSALGQRLEMAP